MKKQPYAEVDPLQALRQFVSAYPTQTAAARELGISGAYLHDLLNGRRSFSAKLLKPLGLKRIVIREAA